MFFDSSIFLVHVLSHFLEAQFKNSLQPNIHNQTYNKDCETDSQALVRLKINPIFSKQSIKDIKSTQQDQVQR